MSAPFISIKDKMKLLPFGTLPDKDKFLSTFEKVCMGRPFKVESLLEDPDPLEGSYTGEELYEKLNQVVDSYKCHEIDSNSRAMTSVDYILYRFGFGWPWGG